MKTAYLYLRVSTPTENPSRALLLQEETLQNYCTQNAIEVDKIFIDQCPGRTLERQGWQRLLSTLINGNKKPDFILFTAWDRLSRNAVDAQLIINAFNKMGIEVLATQQGRIEQYIPVEKLLSELKNIPEK